MKRIVQVNRETMNALLPSIPPEFEKQMREMLQAMPAERKEPKMRRKISLGLVLALILCLLTVGALAAALLGGKDFVDQIMAPKAAESQSEKYTSEEVKEILRIAEENNLSLNPSDVERLNRMEEGYWKEELMRLFVKTEYGFYPAGWPIEVQHWYDEMLEACGQGDGHIDCVLPAEGEISQETAVQTAVDYIHDHYDPDADVTNEAKYRRMMTYYETVKTPWLTTREWTIDWEALDLYSTDYHLTITPQGEVTMAYPVPGIRASSFTTHGQDIYDRISRLYGDRYGRVNWTSEILLPYQEAARARYEAEGTGLRVSEYPLLDMTYLLPDDTVISREAAIEKARAALGDMNWDTLSDTGAVAVLMQGKSGPVWKVSLEVKGAGKAYVQLDAKDGRTLFTDASLDGAGSRTWREYVTEEYWEENKPQNTWRSADTARAEEDRHGTPAAIWGAERFPAWYWEKLDAVGYSAETANELYDHWLNTYGEKTYFWPLEAQAIDYIWHDIYDADTTRLPGLPSEGDLSEEEALKLAKAAFKEEYKDEIPDLEVSSLQGAFSYWFNDPTEGENSWQVFLIKPDGSYAGLVYLVSDTGEVISLEAADSKTGSRIPKNSTRFTPSAPASREDGKPWMWEMDFAPAEFWARLEQLMQAYDTDQHNIYQRAAQWDQQYTDQAFWPLECGILYNCLTIGEAEIEEDSFMYMTFPKEGGITQEQAMEIGRQEFLRLLKEQGVEYTQDWLNSFRPGAVLWQEKGQDEAHWWVQMYTYEADMGFWNPKLEMSLSEDGEILFSELNLYGNG